MEWMTVKQVAEYLGVSEQTIRKWVNEGLLKSYRLGKNKHNKFKKSDIEKFCEEAQ